MHSIHMSLNHFAVSNTDIVVTVPKSSTEQERHMVQIPISYQLKQITSTHYHLQDHLIRSLSLAMSFLKLQEITNILNRWYLDTQVRLCIISFPLHYFWALNSLQAPIRPRIHQEIQCFINIKLQINEIKPFISLRKDVGCKQYFSIILRSCPPFLTKRTTHCIKSSLMSNQEGRTFFGTIREFFLFSMRQ